MARKRISPSICARLFSKDVIKPVIYYEGGDEDNYLNQLFDDEVIKPFEKGTKLQATEIKKRIDEIQMDLKNDAIEQIIWIVDGGDLHIKESKFFKTFYCNWLKNKDTNDFRKLSILINAPCLEYWFLLHKVDAPTTNSTPTLFENANVLLGSQVFKVCFPAGKGGSLPTKMAMDNIGRKTAIERAKTLPQLEACVTNTFQKAARAEMFQLFDRDSRACVSIPKPSFVQKT